MDIQKQIRRLMAERGWKDYRLAKKQAQGRSSTRSSEWVGHMPSSN